MLAQDERVRRLITLIVSRWECLMRICQLLKTKCPSSNQRKERNKLKLIWFCKGWWRMLRTADRGSRQIRLSKRNQSQSIQTWALESQPPFQLAPQLKRLIMNTKSCLTRQVERVNLWISKQMQCLICTPLLSSWICRLTHTKWSKSKKCSKSSKMTGFSKFWRALCRNLSSSSRTTTTSPTRLHSTSKTRTS